MFANPGEKSPKMRFANICAFWPVFSHRIIQIKPASYPKWQKPQKGRFSQIAGRQPMFHRFANFLRGEKLHFSCQKSHLSRYLEGA
jgi:hypothetical protein